tara:strand:- start:1191 stop:1676 length:486 start_codon:yes stop_codon:yes gene_type:complete
MIIPMLLSVFVHAVHSVVYTTTFISVSVSAVKLNVMSSQSASVAALFTMVIFLVIRHNFRRALKVFAEHSVGSLALMEKTTLVHSTSMHELPLVQSPTSCIRNDEVKDVRVLTYNFFCRPPFVSNNGEGAYALPTTLLSSAMIAFSFSILKIFVIFLLIRF